jgi:hypothetical protein
MPPIIPMNDDVNEERLLRLMSLMNDEPQATNTEESTITEEERYDLAIHEASHAVIAYQLDVKFTKTSIRCINPKHGGKTEYDSKIDGETGAKVSLAGPFGEKEYRPESNWELHGDRDFREAKKCVMSLTLEWESEHSEFREEAERRLKPIEVEVEQLIIQYKNQILDIANALMQSDELSYEDVKKNS